MSSDRPLAPARLGFAADPRLTALVTELDARRVRWQVLRLSVLGEHDVRVEVCADGTDVGVELLWSGGGCSLRTPHWHAVRVRGDERAVWRGPAHSCDPPDLAGFLVALLTLAEPELHRRYHHLG